MTKLLERRIMFHRKPKSNCIITLDLTVPRPVHGVSVTHAFVRYKTTRFRSSSSSMCFEKGTHIKCAMEVAQGMKNIWQEWQTWAEMGKALYAMITSSIMHSILLLLFLVDNNNGLSLYFLYLTSFCKNLINWKTNCIIVTNLIH